ncbi:cellulose biosynthesis protein BcsE [Serratia sp. DD3]|uniref:cellulose biosynthesis protein BcsE n=1 Tax=Serratia sp. DD3 TaxID=1410619 RepID=UPI0003C4E43B|nr:cellulose biosynthesis protein BcsE [Serratia sp. DD3]KEY60465.1 cellulose biosynthesis protein BcsE [Serratia sp. DD3]
MAQYFSLGIRHIWQELSEMQAPGFYWVNADRQRDADLLCQQIIAAQEESRSLALICSGDLPDQQWAEHLSAARLKKCPWYTLPEKKAALWHLTDDLMRALRPKNRLLILLAHANLWQTFTSQELQSWGNQLNSWLEQQQCTLLVLCYGSGVNKLKGQLGGEHRLLHGLASLQWQQDHAQYLVNWWSTENSIQANQSFTLLSDELGWQAKENNNQPSPTLEHNDSSRYLAEKRVLEGAPALSSNWQLLENNTQVMQLGMEATAATLIFALYKTDEIDPLAQHIHSLRRSRGDGLKIAVREMSASLRYSDERLLLACGTNLIVPHVAPLSTFLTMLEGIQGQRLSRHIPQDISALIAGVRPLQLKGYLPPEEFNKAVLSLMENTLLPEDGKGVMVALRPAPGLTARQSMTLCHQRRYGDIMTVAQNRLFLFLSTCRINDLDTALKFIFRLPVNEAFSNRIVWSQDIDITAQIRLLTQDIGLSFDDSQPEVKVTKPAVTVAEAAAVERRDPVPITLLSREPEGGV